MSGPPPSHGLPRAVRLDWSPLTTPYSIEVLKEEVPPEGGLYILWSKRPNGKWSCRYVGNSDHLLMDMARHVVSTTWQPLVTQLVTQTEVGFHFAVLEHPEARSGVAKYLHEYFQPRLSADPGGRPIPANLPDDRTLVLTPAGEQGPKGSDLVIKTGARGAAYLLRHWLRVLFGGD